MLPFFTKFEVWDVDLPVFLLILIRLPYLLLPAVPSIKRTRNQIQGKFSCYARAPVSLHSEPLSRGNVSEGRETEELDARADGGSDSCVRLGIWVCKFKIWRWLCPTLRLAGTTSLSYMLITMNLVRAISSP